jgi:hypothetical protein
MYAALKLHEGVLNISRLDQGEPETVTGHRVARTPFKAVPILLDGRLEVTAFIEGPAQFASIEPVIRL